NGCPLLAEVRDPDHDGVPDDRDKCPNTPPNTAVDQYGCIILFHEERVAPPAPGAAPGAPPPRPTLILQGVHFQTGRSVLTLDSYVVLDQVAGSLVANPEIRIEIAGYTDSTGSLAVNTRLSTARPPDRLTAQTRPFQATDYYRMTFVGDPVLSPDGRRAAFTVTTVVEDKDRRHTEIWMAPTDGSAPPYRFTSPSFEAGGPT